MFGRVARQDGDSIAWPATDRFQAAGYSGDPITKLTPGNSIGFPHDGRSAGVCLNGSRYCLRKHFIPLINLLPATVRHEEY